MSRAFAKQTLHAIWIGRLNCYCDARAITETTEVHTKREIIMSGTTRIITIHKGQTAEFGGREWMEYIK